MKKIIISIMMALFIVISFAVCSKTSDQEK